MVRPDDPLPIDDAIPALMGALEHDMRAVLVAPPGAGKTTRVPLALLDAPWRGDRRIIMLEPRRLAARAAAARMAATLGEPVGETVGYRVRLDARVSPRTRIEVVTEGVFTRMLLEDPGLETVAAVLFDEFHERSLEGDLGLALTLDASLLREDLRILVMSATLDGARVSALLGDAPVIESLGRAFPVVTRHVPRNPLERLETQMARTIAEAMKAEPGSVLAFLPGQAEIARTAEALAGRIPADVDVLPLHGQLDAAAQDRAIAPANGGRRKIVLATAIAETSLTIEGVRIVVDSGLARVPLHDPATGLTTLATRPVSRAGADQRRGRAGRTEPGICYRLWAEAQTAARPAFETPEILAADLAGLVLDLALWGVADPAQLRFTDPPPRPAWTEARALLETLGAIDAGGRITPSGKALSRLPLHPRLAHMVIGAVSEGAAEEAARLAVLLGERGLGGDDSDLDHRLERLARERGPRADNARTLASRWAARAGSGTTSTERLGAGHHLARAYPDRIAQAAGGRGRFRLANGRAASLDGTDALADAAFLVVADITGSAGAGRIRAAARIERTTIETLFSGQIIETESVAFDEAGRSLRARKRRQLGALLLDDRTAPVPPGPEAAQCLAAGIAGIGISTLPWTKEQKVLRARANYLHRTLGEPWPDLSDETLACDGAAWLAPHLSDATSLAEIDAQTLDAALGLLLPWALRPQIDTLLPSHFTAPTGNRIPIDYEAENGPALTLRVQELFGLDVHPSVANGQVRLLLILLSPAQRPIQTTRDLPGFWRGSWKDVAKDLKGRYPRHHWPDDPLTADPTVRAKPRRQ
ncbi:ATP-dependent helicase HrpB [Arsenicitalea aurantiaca]|uniref:ATP-dependent helicase HrpB n=1 Tax=Arsenicitalea aurantiaca TaxID=1783274 RepID=A0A433XJY9_9HYPH|nr:ATP-dependent helicase HrpB [Arsenicitalea aurantiaca]RUT34402.1 ATP-dependent helicase HrpB [Arsenicitalea aurantiaca]